MSFSSQDKKTSNRLDALLSLRGFACLMVIIAHCNPPRASIFYQNHDFTWLIFSAGGVAVRIFFCLSGYLMGKAFYTERYSIDVPGLIKFWRNRIVRIFPLYYFVLLILILFVYPEILKSENWGYLIRISTFTYHQALPIVFNGAFWSLSTEVQFYLIIPFIFSYFKQRLISIDKVLLAGFIIIFTSFVLRYAIWIVITAQGQDLEAQSSDFVKYIYTPLITNLDLFISGFLVNSLIYNQKTAQKNQENLIFITDSQTFIKFLAVFMIVFLYLLTAYCKYYFQQLLLFIAPTLSAFVTSFFIFAFESGERYQESYQNEKLSFNACIRNPLRTLEVLGNLSYGIYLWHFSIIAKFNPIVTSRVPLEAYFQRLGATLIISGLLASVTYYLVEKPAVKFKTYRKP